MEEEFEYSNESLFDINIFKDIKVGDILVFRDLHDLYHDQRINKINYSWDTGNMDVLIGKEIVVTQEMIPKLMDKKGLITYIDGWTIGTDMLQPKNYKKPEQEKPGNMADEPKVNFSIIRHTEESTIQEMISKVDYERFRKLMSIGSSGNASKHDLDKILREWACAKSDFYLLFGRSLTLESSIELEMSRAEMTTLVEEKLYKKFPRHYAILSRFDMQEFIVNEINGSINSFSIYCGDMYKRGKKLSKFIAEYCQDKELNDALANVLGNRKIISKIAISIDPYDYLTMSLNNHRWTSCQKLGEGEFASACLALILDSTTLVGYKYSGENTTYNYHGYEFSGNSKAWRQCVYYDRNTSSILFSRQYPDEIDGVAKALREMIELKVSEYLGARNIWGIKYDESQQYYEVGSELLYHDVEHGAGTHCQVTHKDCKDEPKFVVGQDYNCLSCGGDMDDEATTHFLCHRCDEGYEEEDEEWDDEEEEEVEF
jgi:hypothetical protein